MHRRVSFSSSRRRIISLLQSPPRLQRILSRVGDNVVRLITRESHECCVHLLAAQTPGFALLCPRSHPSARTRDQSLSS